MFGVHEVVLWSSDNITARFTGSSGTNFKLHDARVSVTNEYLRISVPQTHTYTVVGKGDTNFHEIGIPLTAAKPHRLIQPWFGPYKWETQIQLPSINGLEPVGDEWTLLLTFTYGGAFDFRTAFSKAFGDASQAASEGIDELLPAYTET